MSEKIVQLNEEIIKGQLKELVRGSVEETLNELLEKEAESLTQAARYERSEARQGYRSGHYDRNLTTTSGDVTLHMPRLKGVSFETAIIERYRRRESSVEEALIEMYLAGVSVRRVEDITEALWGSKVSPATISELNKKAYVHIEDWRNRPLQGGRYPYVYVDGIYLRRNWGGEYENVAVLVAIAVNEDGFREVLGAAEGMKEDKASWVSFFQWLRGRGLDGVKLIVGDKCMGMLEAVGEVFPDAKYQRCTVHFYRNVFSVVPKSKVKIVAKMLKAIHAQESKKASREKAKAVVAELRAMKLKEAAKKVEDGIEETLTNAGYDLTLNVTNNHVEEEARILQSLISRRVDGVIVEGTKTAFPNPNVELYRKLEKMGVPVVFFNSYYRDLPDSVYVVTDDRKAGLQAVDLLIEKGCRRIGGVFKSDDMQGHGRYAGFSEGLIHNGCALGDDNVVWYTTAERSRLFRPDNSDYMFERLRGCDGIVCYNDQIAYGVIDLLQKHNVRVPEDVLVIGFDDSSISEYSPVKITSFVHPKVRWAEPRRISSSTCCAAATRSSRLCSICRCTRKNRQDDKF